jgi:hypothetical protein
VTGLLVSFLDRVPRSCCHCLLIDPCVVVVVLDGNRRLSLFLRRRLSLFIPLIEKKVEFPLYLSPSPSSPAGWETFLWDKLSHLRRWDE